MIDIKKILITAMKTLFILTITINIDKVYAEGGDINLGHEIIIPGTTDEPGSPSGENKCQNIPSGYSAISSSSSCSAYVYKIKWGVESKLRDLKGNYLDSENPAIAGTAIMASLYEYKEAYWKVIQSRTTVYEQNQGDCLYWGWTFEWELNHLNAYYGCKKRADKKSFSCTSTSDGCSVKSQIKEAQKLGYKLARQEVEKQTKATYKMIIEDPNNANCPKAENCQTYEIVNSEPIKPDPMTENNIPNPVTGKFYYKASSTCLNVKTGKVKYVLTGEECETDEMKVENQNDKNWWTLFTPLNSKSNEEIELKYKSEWIDDIEECKKMYETYKTNAEYVKYIIPKTGTYSKTFEDYKRIEIEKGCYKIITHPFPVIQKFYNEETDEKTKEVYFKGFNFYYKPIDINNPFPNGIAKDSYWTDLYNATTNIIKTNNGNGNVNIKLSDSYKELTYVATDIDSQSIKEYNKEDNGMIKVNTYTSWSNMNPDGTSNFVKDNLTVVGKQSKFKLGCGPHNINEYLDAKKTQKNPYYQEECVK